MSTDANDIIDTLAADCAHAHLAQGWDRDGEPYELGNFLGDHGALHEALGRAPTSTEARRLESAIRAALEP